MGFLSILNTQVGNYEIACYYILIAAAFDSVDGKLARMIGISTNFGKEIDSLADMVSFCLAPSVLVYNLYTQNLHPS
jgi:CDP-diacylglycerol--serine O-phosphatidyltransferase